MTPKNIYAFSAARNLNVCLKAINFSNECGYFSNFLRERSRWKIWLCRKSVAKKLHSLKKRLKTCLILKKFSWEKHHWDASIIGTCFNFPNLRRTDSSSNQFFLWKLFNAKRWVRDRKKNQANSQWCAKLSSVAVVRLCPIVNWVWNKNPIYFREMASFFSAPLRFFNSSHTHISSFEITFLERRNIHFIGEPEIRKFQYPFQHPCQPNDWYFLD